jgi:hypothetical protein
MKALKAIIIAIMLFISTLISADLSASVIAGSTDSTVVMQSTDEEKLFDRFEKALIYGLSSDVIGVVESSLFNSVNFKVSYPNFSSNKVIEELGRVALEGDNHSLRYRAYLALSYYRAPGQFDSPEVLLAIIDTRYQDGIFFYLQDKVQNDQFTSNQ